MATRSTPKSGSPAGSGFVSGAYDSGSIGTAPSSVTFPTLIQISRPYLSAEHIAILSQQANNSNGVRESQSRFHAFALIINTGNQLRFPVRTLGSAMVLFQQFYLFNSLQNFSSVSDTALACLLVASKMEDTLKKIKDILIAAYNVRHPNGPEISLDSQVLDEQRRRSLFLERQVLETMSFDFRVKHPHPYVIKFCRKLTLGSEQAQLAWLICFDSYKTLAPLKHTAHAIALASIYIAGVLLDRDISGYANNTADFLVDLHDYENIILELLELYIDWLPQTTLASRFPDLDKFMSMRIEVNKRLSHSNGSDNQFESKNDILKAPKIRDFTIGDKGTMRYVLDSERAKVEESLL
ncbi:cyclin-like protein [Kockiozyma suomiensis]|uniref:cyclin-like protein n=1 Tax=Kockiozyma suomiensis TaxID=1337062 RepID=UPI0033433BCF